MLRSVEAQGDRPPLENVVFAPVRLRLRLYVGVRTFKKRTPVIPGLTAGLSGAYSLPLRYPAPHPCGR